MIKAEFACDNALCVVFITIVSRPKRQGVVVGRVQKGAYLGDEVHQNMVY